MVDILYIASALFFAAAAGAASVRDGVVYMEPLVVRGTARTELDCRRIPLRNGRDGESVLMCEGGLPHGD